MLPAMRTKEIRLFPGNRKPSVEIICPHYSCQPLGSLARLTSRLLDGSPYGSEFPTRVVAHSEFSFGISFSKRQSASSAVKEVAALCAKRDAIVMFNIVEEISFRGQVAGAVNFGYIASKQGVRKERKIADAASWLDVRRRAVEKNGHGFVFLLCYEATLKLRSVQPSHLLVVPAYGISATEAAHNFKSGRAFIVNDGLAQKACGEFGEADFWTMKRTEGATYFWLWE